MQCQKEWQARKMERLEDSGPKGFAHCAKTHAVEFSLKHSALAILLRMEEEKAI